MTQTATIEETSIAGLRMYRMRCCGRVGVWHSSRSVAENILRLHEEHEHNKEVA